MNATKTIKTGESFFELINKEKIKSILFYNAEAARAHDTPDFKSIVVVSAEGKIYSWDKTVNKPSEFRAWLSEFEMPALMVSDHLDNWHSRLWSLGRFFDLHKTNIKFLDIAHLLTPEGEIEKPNLCGSFLGKANSDNLKKAQAIKSCYEKLASLRQA
ncbi:MAG TPA: hypothetical protein VNI84_01360 [Pyrinomonadaceae bacterium]|nr:hypothetical protein [Pyrinomonadaceae bacterium]